MDFSFFGETDKKKAIQKLVRFIGDTYLFKDKIDLLKHLRNLTRDMMKTELEAKRKENNNPDLGYFGRKVPINS